MEDSLTPLGGTSDKILTQN